MELVVRRERDAATMEGAERRAMADGDDRLAFETAGVQSIGRASPATTPRASATGFSGACACSTSGIGGRGAGARRWVGLAAASSAISTHI
jgi:hypothetical protein